MNAPLPEITPGIAPPDDSPAPPQSALRLLRRFMVYLWPRDEPGFRLRIILAFMLLFAAKAIGLAMPFAYKRAVDALDAKTGLVVTVAVSMIAAYAAARFAGVLFEQLRNAVYERVGQRAVTRLARDVFAHLHKLSLRYHLERRTGGLSRIMERGIKSIDSMLYFLLFNIVPTIFELAAVCVIFWINIGWQMTVATLVSVIIYIAFTRMVTEWRTQLRRSMVESDTKANSRAIDSLLNYETVKYFNNEPHENAQYAKAMQRYEDATVKSETSLAWLNGGQSFITSALMAGSMIWIALGIPKGQYTVGDLVLVQTLLAQLFRPLDMLGWVYREIRQGLIDMEQMYNLLDKNQEIKDAADARPLMPRGGAVTFTHVDFAYEPRRQILHDVSFNVPAGQTLAIVGHSGAGKSTISRILYRFYDITKGQVLVDGQDLRDVTQISLRQAIGIVPQDTVLFNDSIGYNIGYGRPGSTQAAIEGAARQAQIHDFITRLPDGYDTVVGERGLKLSGGEKQRVAIARTILKDPPILILDEATSALDTATERDIQSALRSVSENRTTLIIAHRLSTVVDADDIIVLAQGRILERGTHSALLNQNGAYATMWASQQQDTSDIGLQTS
jgi:ATP-binding cassette, subfamily B, heavy metal transporter